MKEVLVLGGGGFIGRNIVEFLVKRGDCNVTAADTNEGSNWLNMRKDPTYSSRLKVVLDDFTEIKAFDQLNQSYDEVYMLAALVGVNRTIKFPDEVIRVNTKLTMNLLDWISKNPIKKLLFASSSENYAGSSDLFKIEIPTPENVPLTISDINHPRWTYAITKMHGESAFIHSARKYGYICTIIRYQNIIGPDMGFGHAIPHIVQRFSQVKDCSVKIYGADQTRAFCYIQDAVTGTVSALEREGTKTETYHIGNNQEIDIRSLTIYIGELMNYLGEYESAMTFPGSVSRRCPDISKARVDLNYSPKVDWKDAVKLTTNWYRDFFSAGNMPDSGGFEEPQEILKRVQK